MPLTFGMEPDQAIILMGGIMGAVSIGGSVSAEHGIGTEKLRWLPHSRTAAEIGLMRTLKSALDPSNILNPGRVLNDDEQASK